MLAGPLHREARGRRQADQGLDAGPQDFLDQFEAATAGDDRHAAGHRDLLPDQRADQLVEGVVPANVFATQQQFALGVHEQRGVDCAAVLAQGLELADTVTQAIEPLGRWQRCAGQHLEVWQCLFHRFHAAQPAATGARQLPTLLLEVPEGAIGDGHLGMVRRSLAAQLQVIDVR